MENFSILYYKKKLFFMCFSYSRACAGIYMPCNEPDVMAHSSYWTCPDRVGGQKRIMIPFVEFFVCI